MTKPAPQIRLRSAALIAGLAILAMVIAAPFSEIYVYPKLVVPGNIVETVDNITANRSLFGAGILGYLLTFIADLVAAWSLFILLKPVNRDLSLLTAWLRLVYSVIALVALLNLVTIFRLLNTPDFPTVFEPAQLNAQVLLALGAFKKGWSFGLVFFGLHLGLLGYLVIRSSYIPGILGVLLIVAGLGYAATSLEPFLSPGTNLHLAEYTFYGELIFMLWLLIRGARIQVLDQEHV